MKTCWLLLFCWTLALQGIWAQSVILLHKPSKTNTSTAPFWNYHKDKVAFTGSAEIWGLVYHDYKGEEQPTIKISMQHANTPPQIITFKLHPLSLATANWHPSLKVELEELLNSPHWYAFQVCPAPSVVTGYDGVNFGKVFYEAAQSSKRQLFRYKALTENNEKIFTVNFEQSKEPWNAIWPIYLHYQGLVEQVNSTQQMQDKLKKQCTPHNYEQIGKWSTQAQELHTGLANSDLGLFKTVENLKIITEDLPSSISPMLKRELHALLQLDIKLLEAKNLSTRASLQEQKAELLKNIALYPALAPILKQYNNTIGKTVQQQRQQEAQLQALKRVDTQLNPYKSILTRLKKLDKRLAYLQEQLTSFD